MRVSSVLVVLAACAVSTLAQTAAPTTTTTAASGTTDPPTAEVFVSIPYTDPPAAPWIVRLDYREARGDPCTSFNQEQCEEFDTLCNWFERGPAALGDGFCAVQCESIREPDCHGFDGFCRYDTNLRICVNDIPECYLAGSDAQCQVPVCQWQNEFTNYDYSHHPGWQYTLEDRCTPNCAVMTTMMTCETAGHCYWTGHECSHHPHCDIFNGDVFGCTNVAPGTATPVCSYDFESDICKLDCERIGQESLCHRTEECHWLEAIHTCTRTVQNCDGLPQHACLERGPICRWEADANGDFSCNKHCGGHTSSYGCELNRDCHWDVASQHCADGHRPAYTDTCQQAYLDNRPTANLTYDPIIDTEYIANWTCTEFSYEGLPCRESNAEIPGADCRVDCNAIQDESICNKASDCQWNYENHFCSPPVYDCHAFVHKKDCPVKPGVCMWDDLGITAIDSYNVTTWPWSHYCRTECSFHQLEISCLQHAECGWFVHEAFPEAGGFCQQNVSYHDPELTCETRDFHMCYSMAPFCMWNGHPYNGNCIRVCETIPDQEACVVAGCHWSHHLCMNKPIDCSAIRSVSECQTHWKQCVVNMENEGPWTCSAAPCETLMTAEVCNLQSEYCYFDPNEGIWGQCKPKEFDCHTVYGPAECNRIPLCHFNYTMARCDNSHHQAPLIQPYNNALIKYIKENSGWANGLVDLSDADPDAAASSSFAGSNGLGGTVGMVGLIAVVALAVVGLVVYAKKRADRHNRVHNLDSEPQFVQHTRAPHEAFVGYDEASTVEDVL